MRISSTMSLQIRRWEGLRLRAYRCPAGVLTIGYGHTGKDVTPGLAITKARADELFEQDIEKFSVGVRRLLQAAGVSLRQEQFDAIVSLSYNIGLTAFVGSNLWRKIKADPDDPTIPTEFSRWVRGGGKVLPGLVKRRAAEAARYQNKPM